MALYCGIDLHSNNHWLTVIDEDDRRLLEKRLPNDVEATLKALEPFRSELAAVAVESTFNWYWLVDGLHEAAYEVKLVNTTAVEQYCGLKYTDDRHDAFWLAHLMRLKILPTGYIYPKAQRAVRDLMRRRMGLVRMAARQLISVQSALWRHTGRRVSTGQIRKVGFVVPPLDPHVALAVRSALTLYHAARHEVDVIEDTVLSAVQWAPEFDILRSMPGVGKVLGMTVMLETGPITRFAGPGDFASYSRCVKSERTSNGKKKGEGNAKSGNKYLSWAFSEAAHFAVRYEPLAKRFYEKKRAQRNGIVAIRALAHKLCRATYFMLRDQVPFDAQRLFAH